MKNKSVLQSILAGLFVVLVLVASNSIVRAQGSPPTTNWIGTSGDWFTATNWSGVQPNPLVDAFINNTGAAQILLGGDGKAHSLTLGDNQGDLGSVSIGDTSSILEIGDGSACHGTIYIGNRGSGNLKIANGSHFGGLTSRYAYIASGVNSTKPNSSGTVTVEGHGTIWYVYDDDTCHGAGLFIGCTADSNGVGGTALVDISDGAFISVHNLDGGNGVMVGLSGTVTGSGTLEMVGPPGASPTPSSITAKVFGTLAPVGLLTIDGNLDLTTTNHTANTVLHVTPQANDEVYVSQHSGGGSAHLDGRVTVIMTGTFTAGTLITGLVHADASLNGTTFRFESIIPPSGGPCINPEIQYDYVLNNVNLYIKSCGGH